MYHKNYIILIAFIASGETSLKATANHWNKEADSNESCHVGYKVDVIFKYQDISWTFIIECMEVSGGLLWCLLSSKEPAN
jgi:hypothetical protein